MRRPASRTGPRVSSPRRRHMPSRVTPAPWPAHRQRPHQGGDADGGDGTTPGRHDAGVRYGPVPPGQAGQRLPMAHKADVPHHPPPVPTLPQRCEGYAAIAGALVTSGSAGGLVRRQAPRQRFRCAPRHACR